MKKILFLLLLLFAVTSYGQEYVKTLTSIPSNNANNAQNEKNAVWRNSVIHPTTSDNFPNDNNNWWSIFQTQFHDVSYDAQLAFGLNTQDMWLRFNYNDTWKPWRKIIVEDDLGNVGIGTSSPSEKLDVRGNLYISSVIDDNHIYWGQHYMTMGTKPGDYYHNILKLEPGGASQGELNSVLKMYKANSVTDHELQVQLHTNGISYFNGGNVLIGKTSQQNSNYKLDVAGSIRANEIKVNSDGADFVFESDYTLKSLNEVESYIKENKHLPDIDPASKMQEDGVNIGEMNTQLLQKIEELTLYTIEQQKEIEELKKQNEKIQLLEKAIEELKIATKRLGSNTP